MRIGFLVLAVMALAALPGCHFVPRAPTPTLTGLDAGWTHVQTVFTSTPTGMQYEGITAVACFDSGDGSMNEGYSIGFPYEHTYAEPGTYVVRCRYMYARQTLDWFIVENRYGDWSNHCTVHILANTMAPHEPLGRGQMYRPRPQHIRLQTIPV